MVLEKALAGPLNLLVKFSTLQEYGVDKPFFLENDNVDASQRNVVFLVRGEKARTVVRVARWASRESRKEAVDDVVDAAVVHLSISVSSSGVYESEAMAAMLGGLRVERARSAGRRVRSENSLKMMRGCS